MQSDSRKSLAPIRGESRLDRKVGGRSNQFLTMMLTPELKMLPSELKASDTRMYEPLGTVVVFHAHSHPQRVAV